MSEKCFQGVKTVPEPETERPLYLLRVWPKAFVLSLKDPSAAIRLVSPRGSCVPAIFYWMLFTVVSASIGAVVEPEELRRFVAWISNGSFAVSLTLLGTIAVMLVGFLFISWLSQIVFNSLGGQTTFHDTCTFVAVTWLPIAMVRSMAGHIHSFGGWVVGNAWLIWLFQFLKLHAKVSVAKSSFVTGLLLLITVVRLVWRA